LDQLKTQDRHGGGESHPLRKHETAALELNTDVAGVPVRKRTHTLNWKFYFDLLKKLETLQLLSAVGR
jgi:hypothetical protein